MNEWMAWTEMTECNLGVSLRHRFSPVGNLGWGKKENGAFLLGPGKNQSRTTKNPDWVKRRGYYCLIEQFCATTSDKPPLGRRFAQRGHFYDGEKKQKWEGKESQEDHITNSTCLSASLASSGCSLFNFPGLVCGCRSTKPECNFL